ncbi:unnamed protein product [Anisakis simplex]|uniref:Uncharacterized protein n=1 Tax=Anisakis simplex TaxID=6269 RepID=A0A0M3JBT7_ANISI|nr:unnamed protein product [Anisakis simplex]
MRSKISMNFEVRNAISNEIHPKYNTHFNILRYCQSCEFNASKTIYMLRRHLRFRSEYELDTNVGENQLSSLPWLEEYAPWTIVGPNRKNVQEADHLIVVEQIGQIDSHGLLKAVEYTKFMHQQFRRMEKLFNVIHKVEC